MAIDFENDNPYAPPVSSGERSYDGDLSNKALEYLRSAGKWARFIAIVNILAILCFFMWLIILPSAILQIAIYLFAAGGLAWFSLKYAQQAQNIQNDDDDEQLSQCLSSTTGFLKVNAIYFILSWVLNGIMLLWAISSSGAKLL